MKILPRLTVICSFWGTLRCCGWSPRPKPMRGGSVPCPLLASLSKNIWNSRGTSYGSPENQPESCRWWAFTWQLSGQHYDPWTAEGSVRVNSWIFQSEDPSFPWRSSHAFHTIFCGLWFAPRGPHRPPPLTFPSEDNAPSVSDPMYPMTHRWRHYRFPQPRQAPDSSSHQVSGRNCFWVSTAQLLSP